MYGCAGWNWGPYPWIKRQIFDETNDIDIAFLGSSRIAFGIDTCYVQDKLAKHLGRQAVVRTIGWGGAGYGTLYFTTRDLLAHRRVKMIAFYSEGANFGPKTPFWFRYCEDAKDISGVNFKNSCAFYLSSVAGIPNNIKELISPDLGEFTNSPFSSWFHSYPQMLLGSVSSPIGGPEGFVPFVPRNGVTPADFRTYSAETKSDFVFSNSPVSADETMFARKFAELVRKNGVRLVLVHIPLPEEWAMTKIPEVRYWPDFLHINVAMAGIVPAKFFGGLTADEIKRLYVIEPNIVHLNRNGQNYFTPLITPALLQLYDKQPIP